MTDGVRPEASSVEEAAATDGRREGEKEEKHDSSFTTPFHSDKDDDKDKDKDKEKEKEKEKQHVPVALISNDAAQVEGGAVAGDGKEAETTSEVVKEHYGDEKEEKAIVTDQNAEKNGEEDGEGKDVEANKTNDGEGGLEDEEANMVFPSGLPLALLTFGLCMATFVVALDNTIIATAIPKITTVFNSLGDVGWYGSSYLLTTTALQPSFGRIYTYFDVRYTYIFALFLFEVGSVLCAAATSSTMLIVGRAVAGAGASAIFSGGMTIVGFTVPLRKRSMYIAALSSMFGVSSVIGPLLGGAFTDSTALTWRFCFWINLPFGGIAITAVWFFFKPPPRKSTGFTLKQKILEIDLLGAFFLICAIICLLLALQWGGFTYAWSDSKVWGCIVGFGLMIAIFIVQQFRRGDRATIPPRIFFQRTVLFCSLFSCFLNMAVYTHIFYLPFYFQAVKGTTAVESGIRTIPYLVSIILASIVVGTSITVVGIYKPFMIVGAAVFTVGAGLIYTLAVDSGAGKWIGYQILAGFGAGAGVQIPFVAIQVVLSSKDMPTGNAIAIFFNSLGGAVSISVAQNIFVNGLVTKIPVYAPHADPYKVFNAGATHIREVVSAADLPGVLQAYMLSLNDSFILPIAVGGVAFGLAWFVESKSVKGKKLVAAGA